MIYIGNGMYAAGKGEYLEHYGRKGMKWGQHIYGDEEIVGSGWSDHRWDEVGNHTHHCPIERSKDERGEHDDGWRKREAKENQITHWDQFENDS